MVAVTEALEVRPVELVNLRPLMDVSAGTPDISIGLIDGPVDTGHPDLAVSRIRELSGRVPATCSYPTSTACMHGTGVAGVLHAKRDSLAVAICPDCTLVVRSIFSETTVRDSQMPSATPEALAEAVVDVISAGVRILNLSVGLVASPSRGGSELEDVLNYAAERGVIVAAAAGNQATLGGSMITRHPWVIPVVACDCRGRPTVETNLGLAIGRRGLGAPGAHVVTLGAKGTTQTLDGTSAATPFVSGAAALLWSAFPMASAADIKLALVKSHPGSRRAIVPPLLNAWAAYGRLQAIYGSN